MSYKQFRSDLVKEMKMLHDERLEQLEKVDSLLISEELKKEARKEIFENFDRKIDEIRGRPGYIEARKAHIAEMKKTRLLKKYESAIRDVLIKEKEFEDVTNTIKNKEIKLDIEIPKFDTRGNNRENVGKVLLILDSLSDDVLMEMDYDFYRKGWTLLLLKNPRFEALQKKFFGWARKNDEGLNITFSERRKMLMSKDGTLIRRIEKELLGPFNLFLEEKFSDRIKKIQNKKKLKKYQEVKEKEKKVGEAQGGVTIQDIPQAPLPTQIEDEIPEEKNSEIVGGYESEVVGGCDNGGEGVQFQNTDDKVSETPENGEYVEFVEAKVLGYSCMVGEVSEASENGEYVEVKIGNNYLKIMKSKNKAEESSCFREIKEIVKDRIGQIDNSPSMIFNKLKSIVRNSLRDEGKKPWELDYYLEGISNVIINNVIVIDIIWDLIKKEESEQQGRMPKTKSKGQGKTTKHELKGQGKKIQHGEKEEKESEDGSLLPEDSTSRIELNVGGTSYEIIRGDRCDDKNWKNKIKNAIENRIVEVIENGMIDSNSCDDNYVNSVLEFILRPFKVGENYDEETIRYYVYGIIGCIEDDEGKIVQRILELYKKREELVKELDELGNSLSLDSLSVIQDYSDIGKTGDFSLENISRFKQGIFCDLLEKKLRDENLEDGDKEVVEAFLKNLNDIGKSEQFNFDAFVNNWVNGEIKIEKFEDRDKFIECFSKILKILGVEPGNLSSIYEHINNNVLGKENKFTREEYLSLIKIIVKKREKTGEEGKILEKWNTKLGRNNTYNKIEKLREIFSGKMNILSLSKSDRQLYQDFQDFMGDVIKTQSVDVKKRESEIRKIFGLGDGNLTNDGSLKGIVVDQMVKFNNPGINDKKLVMEILKALVKKINEEKAGKGELIQGVLEEINFSEMGDTLKNLLDNIDVKIRQWLHEEYGSEGRNNGELENIVGALGDIRHDLDDCCSLEDYRNIESKIENVTKRIESNEYMVKVQKANQYLYQFKNWENCDISELQEPLKWLIVLKRFFVCEDFTLMEKFEYSEFIFDCIKNTGQKKSQKIYSKKPEHDRILVSLFGEENVVKKNKGGSGNDEDINIGRSLHPTEEKILNEFGILLGETNEIYDKKGKSFDFCTKFCEILFKEEKQKEAEKEKQKQKEKEIKKMYDIFGEDLFKAYIARCLKEGLIFKNSRAIKTTEGGGEGELDFSVIQAGILEVAFEKGKIVEVLEHLGFRFDIEAKMCERINTESTDTASTILPIIQKYQEDKVGCFDLSGKKGVCRFPPYVRAEGGGVFTIGEGKDLYRFDGLIDGFVIKKYFSQEGDGDKWHDEHEEYVKKLKGEKKGKGKKSGKKN